MPFISPRLAFKIVSFSLGELGDGLNIFQGIYLVGNGWNEGSVGIALSLMGLTALLVQTFAGDMVDKTKIDRRIFLATASIVTALSASAILFVQKGNTDHLLIFVTKIIEGIAGSFIGPCLGALTLACFGPQRFDKVMASNILWGHIGSVVAAILTGIVAYVFYPNIKYCFLIIGFSALTAVLFVGSLPQGDPLMGRGFKGRVAMNEQGHLEAIDAALSSEDDDDEDELERQLHRQDTTQQASSYWEVFSDAKTCILCLTGFFFHFANANVLLVLGELMGIDYESGGAKRAAIPLTAGAIVLAQFTMALANMAGDRLTQRGMGRKPLFMFGLITLPIRCALIIVLKDAGDFFLLSTQILDGVGAGLGALIHAYLVADITFGSGRFNVLSKYCICFDGCFVFNDSQTNEFSHPFRQWGLRHHVLDWEPLSRTF